MQSGLCDRVRESRVQEKQYNQSKPVHHPLRSCTEKARFSVFCLECDRFHILIDPTQ
ncbi:hypothetical protein [Kamptonema sp. PCC 6506]|uniref:hypothetical protein n=2 Tax=Kamptonema TaxID=1501433 RepID=UPI0002F57AF8|nr:hypothetical protein [Kamptonema sp. PCC 6506]